MRQPPRAQRGFTLIELSIVLVIIGLIVGGVLVGQDLIRAAGVRAQISQLEKYRTAANTFYGKYGYLPGDIKDPDASNFGFAARGTQPGQGDGDGVLIGVGSGGHCGLFESAGETAMFWVDLSKAGLIDGTFNAASPTNPNGSAVVGAWFPSAKIGGANYIYVWSGGYQFGQGRATSINYFGLSAVTAITSDFPASTPGLTVQQAYNTDKKIDDGLPQAGNVMALYGNGGVAWAAGGGANGAVDTTTNSGGPVFAGDGVATPASANTCYDNAGVAGATESYSLSQNGGAGVNCALSFRFQ